MQEDYKKLALECAHYKAHCHHLEITCGAEIPEYEHAAESLGELEDVATRIVLISCKG